MNPILLAAATLGDKIDSAFYAFDMWVFHLFGSMQCGFLTTISKIFTTFGDEAFVIPMAILGIVLCLFKKTRKYGFALIFAIAIGTIVTNVVVKPMALRIRPYNTLQGNAEYWAWYKGVGMLSESDYSFPSGHTTAAFEMATAMFLCFMSDKKKKIAWIFPVLAILTMCSRVYLMVHYASDVLCGLVVGICAGVIAFFLSKLVCRIFKRLNSLIQSTAINSLRNSTKRMNTPINGIKQSSALRLLPSSSLPISPPFPKAERRLFAVHITRNTTARTRLKWMMKNILQ